MGMMTTFAAPIVEARELTENTATPGAGNAIQITATQAGTVTLTLLRSGTVVVTVAVGDNIYPYAVTKATVGTATISKYYNLFL